MLNSAPLGIYDSGVGGLTVWRSIRSRLPREKVIYYGDSIHVPYGGRAAGEIQRFSWAIIDFLVSEGVKLVVAACNTSSALALPLLAELAPVPVVGMIQPTVAVTVRVTRNGRVGLLATEGTVQSRMYERLIGEVAPDITLVSQACPRLVPLIEAGHIKGSRLIGPMGEYLAPLLEKEVDCIILGCTHYPLIAETIQAIVGPDVVLIDPAEAVAEQVETLLLHGVGSNTTGYGEDAVYVSGDAREFATSAGLLGFHLTAGVRRISVHGSINDSESVGRWLAKSQGGNGAGAEIRGGVTHAMERKAGSSHRPGTE